MACSLTILVVLMFTTASAFLSTTPENEGNGAACTAEGAQKSIHAKKAEPTSLNLMASPPPAPLQGPFTASHSSLNTHAERPHPRAISAVAPVLEP